MQIINGIVRLDEAKSISPPAGNEIAYTDATGTRVIVPLATLIRLYGIAQFEAERAGQDWEASCKALTAI